MTIPNFSATRRILLCIAVYVAATIWLTWPLAPYAATAVGFSNKIWHADHLLVIWILRWGLHSLATNPFGLLDANAFHPAPGVLARSELMLGLLPPYGVLFSLTDNAVLALNLLTLGSFVLSGLAMHLLVKRWTGSAAAAYAAGLSFAFAPWRLMTVGGPEIVPPTGAPHLLQTQYLPLILLALDACARAHRWRWMILGALLLAVQTACSFYLGYMGFVLAGMYLLALALGRREKRDLRDLLFPAGAIVLGAALVLPLALPYLRAQSAGALATEWTDGHQIVAATFGSPGAVVASYAGVAAAALATLVVLRGRKLAEPRLLALLLIAVGSLLLAPGPAGVLDGWLAPYAWLSAFVPGMTNLRSTWRFGILAGFAVSALAGYALREVLARISSAPLAALVAGAAIVTLVWPALSGPPMVMVEVPSKLEVPPVYRWLARRGEHGPLLELPLGQHADEVLRGAESMYFSTYHWLPVLTGHTGYWPDSYRALKPFFERLPDRDALQVLVACTRLRWIVRHEPPNSVTPGWGDVPGLIDRGVFPDRRGTARLYEVTMRTAAGCPLAIAALSDTATHRAVSPVADDLMAAAARTGWD